MNSRRIWLTFILVSAFTVSQAEESFSESVVDSLKDLPESFDSSELKVSQIYSIDQEDKKNSIIVGEKKEERGSEYQSDYSAEVKNRCCEDDCCLDEEDDCCLDEEEECCADVEAGPPASGHPGGGGGFGGFGRGFGAGGGAGVVAGNGENGGNGGGGMVIPEPTTLIILGGMAASAGCLKRKRQKLQNNKQK